MSEPSFAPSLDEFLFIDDSVRPWIAVVRQATEPCLVLDRDAQILAVSPSACHLLGFGDPADAIGLSLLAGVLRLLDFTTDGVDLPPGELERTPPMLATSSGRLARGLMRVLAGGDVRTLDAIATPLMDGHTVIGSLTFLSQI